MYTQDIKVSKYPGWVKIIVVAVISAACCGGIVAGICIYALTPQQQEIVPTETSSERESRNVADDAGGITALDDSRNPLIPPPPSNSLLGQFSHAAVAVDSKDCAKVGRDILVAGGTAVDSAVAALFCNGVVASQSMGIGGGFLMTIHLANGTTVSLVAREMAPRAASRDMFRNASSTIGPLTAGVPGEVRGYWEAKQRYGNPDISWAQLIKPSIDFCKNGIKVTEHAANMLKRSERLILKDPGLRSVFINKKTGKVWRQGDIYTHPKLGKTLQRIADNGADEFYTGEVAKNLINDMTKDGGIITSDDLANYKVSWEKPVSGKLPNTGGLTVHSSPAPGSGSVMSAILGIAGQYKPLPVDVNRVTSWHRFIEACKFSYASRTKLGDWNSNSIEENESVRSVVAKMISEEWWKETKEKIDDMSTNPDPAWYGAEYLAVEDSGTSHISILSPSGEAVSVTSTVNLLYGSKYMSPSTGILLNNQMDDFSYPGFVNAFGYPPSEANMVAPGKRPLSSMSPSIVVDDDNRVVAVVGASGGSKIITSVAQVIYRLVYMKQTAKQAVDSRRFHHQLVPMKLLYEDGVTKWIVDGLETIGHNMTKTNIGGSIIQAIMVDRDTGAITANADFRKGGNVEGF